MPFSRPQKIFFVFLTGIFLLVFVPQKSEAAVTANFYVESRYDAEDRTFLKAVHVASGYNVNIYADQLWWDFTPRTEAEAAVEALVKEFDGKIYPVLTSAFGAEWNPGIDKDAKVVILIEMMKDNMGGYFKTNDEYSKFLATDSNEHEMFYVNSKRIFDPNLKAYVAHEFMHLITFNQKNQIYNEDEDVWLDEARAQYAPTLLGYNDIYEGSYLENKAQGFLERPNDSLVDWQETKDDYGRALMFITYLVDHYGVKTLVDSLHSPKRGIESIEYALEKNDFKEKFYQIFFDWTIAVFVNNCDYGSKYCYLSKNLKNFYLPPAVNFLPVSGSTTLTFSDNTKHWTGNWYKLIGGGGGTLMFNFEKSAEVPFDVAILKKNSLGNFNIGFMSLDSAGKDEIAIEGFGKDVMSLIIIAVARGDHNSPLSKVYPLSWSASINKIQKDSDSEEIKKIMAAIAELQQKIAQILQQKNQDLCPLNADLYFGIQNSTQVKCLQEFLKIQGQAIYPEGLVTGNFGNFTKQAVIRFQEKYAQEILASWGLSVGTGRVGPTTRNKINQMIGSL